MHAHMTMNCSTPCLARAPRPSRSARRGLRARLVLFTVALAALLVMLYGQRWVIERSPRTADELTVATCIADVLYGGRTAACTDTESTRDKESAL